MKFSYGVITIGRVTEALVSGGGGVTLRSLGREGPASSLCGMLEVLRIGMGTLFRAVTRTLILNTDRTGGSSLGVTDRAGV